MIAFCIQNIIHKLSAIYLLRIKIRFMSAHLNIQKHFIKCKIMSLCFSITFIPFLLEYKRFFSSSVSSPYSVLVLSLLYVPASQKKKEALVSSSHSIFPH